MSRPYTQEEVQYLFLEQVQKAVQFWKGSTVSEGTKLEGVALSILGILDGTSVHLPGFIVAPNPLPCDTEYYRDLCTKWYPENHAVEYLIKSNISGELQRDFLTSKRPDSLDQKDSPEGSSLKASRFDRDVDPLG